MMMENKRSNILPFNFGGFLILFMNLFLFFQIERMSAQCQFENGLYKSDYFKLHEIKKQTIYHSTNFSKVKDWWEETFYDRDGNLTHKIHCVGDTDRFYYENGKLKKEFFSSCENTRPDVTVTYTYFIIDKIDYSIEAYEKVYSSYRTINKRIGKNDNFEEVIITDSLGNQLIMLSKSDTRAYRFRSNNCIDSIIVLDAISDTVSVTVQRYDEISRVKRKSDRPIREGQSITEDIMSLDEFGLPEFYVLNWVESGIVLNTECTYFFYKAGLLTKTVTIDSSLRTQIVEYLYEFY